MKVQLFAAASAGALTLFMAGAALATPPGPPGPPGGGSSDPSLSVNAAVGLGLGNQTSQGNTVPGNSSAGGDLTSKDNVSNSGTGNVGGDNTNVSVNKSNSGTQVSDGSSLNTGVSASKGGSVNSGNQAALGSTANSGNYASKGGTNNSGTQASDGGTVNTGNNASKGGQIQTGSNDVGGDVHNTSITNSGARTWSLLKVSTDQTLTSTVTGNKVGGWTWNGTANTGSVSLTESGFAGVQTASSNSGLNSANQAATAVAANASITFGNVH